MATAVINDLKKATKGLLYPSETDEPFQTFLWKDGGDTLATEEFLRLSGHKQGSNVEPVQLEEFFADLTTDQDWYGETEKATARKYRQLLQTLKKHLSDLRVFRVGKVDLEIYIVGKTPSGDWAGIKTKAVET